MPIGACFRLQNYDIILKYAKIIYPKRFALHTYLQDNGQVVGVGVLVVVAVEGAAGFGAEVLFVRFEEPGRCENVSRGVRFEGLGDVKLVEKSPDTVVFVRATGAERCLVGKRKHEVGHAGEVVGRCGVHVAHNDDTCQWI